MHRGKAVAAAFLAVGFAIVSFTLLVIEPRMGFTGPADFLDPAKVRVAAASAAWLVGDLVYLGFGIALGYLAVHRDGRAARGSGMAAAAGFVFIASLGRVLAVLPTMLGDPGAVDAALLGVLPVRLAALRTTVVALGVFAWRTTRDESESVSAAGRALGFAVLAGSGAFVFVFFPAPVLFTIWAIWLASRRVRNA